MDLTKFLGQDTQEPSAQRLSKEEYAAQKKQEREEIWGMIDGKAQVHPFSRRWEAVNTDAAAEKIRIVGKSAFLPGKTAGVLRSFAAE